MTAELHEVTAEGGLGFCQAALGSVLPDGYHGPLVVALDSSVLIDLRTHGDALLDDVRPDGVDDAYAEDLQGLADILNLWLLRDIRFVVTPRSLTDLRGDSTSQRERRRLDVEAVAETLAFQFGDWTALPPSHQLVSVLLDAESGLPVSADKDLVLEAQAVGAHVFLTRDLKVLKRVKLKGPPLWVTSPSQLQSIFGGVGVTPFRGGTCDDSECPYGAWDLPAPDMGRWGALLSLFG